MECEGGSPSPSPHTACAQTPTASPPSPYWTEQDPHEHPPSPAAEPWERGGGCTGWPVAPMGARGPCPQRFPGAVVGKSRTTGSCYRTSVSSTIAKGSPGAGHCWHHRHRLSSQAPAWGWGRRGGGGSGMTRGRDARPGKLQKIGKKKKKFTHPARKLRMQPQQIPPVRMLGLTRGRCHPRGSRRGQEGGVCPIPLVMATTGDTAWPRCLHGLGHHVGMDTPPNGTPRWDLSDIPPSPQQFQGGFHFPIPGSIPHSQHPPPC